MERQFCFPHSVGNSYMSQLSVLEDRVNLVKNVFIIFLKHKIKIHSWKDGEMYVTLSADGAFYIDRT